jgi:hypothetical protein
MPTRRLRARARLASRPARETLSRHYRGTRLLLAEDDLVSQQVARDLLLAVGLQVDVVGDGRQAVDRVRAPKPMARAATRWC